MFCPGAWCGRVWYGATPHCSREIVEKKKCSMVPDEFRGLTDFVRGFRTGLLGTSLRLGLYWNTRIFGNFPRLKFAADLAIYVSALRKFDYIALDRLISV